MMPVRCFSCGAVVADKWEEYDKRVNKDHEDADKVLDELGGKEILLQKDVHKQCRAYRRDSCSSGGNDVNYELMGP